MQKALLFLSLLVTFAAVFWAGEISLSLKQCKEKYTAHTKAIQWVSYMNFLRSKFPNSSPEELVTSLRPAPFTIPDNAVFFVLSQKEKTGIFEDCDFGVEIDSPSPFVVYNNGLTFNARR